MSSAQDTAFPARIVMVAGSLQSGGAERQLSEMANFWARRGAQVTLATWSGRDVADFYPIDSNVRRVWLGGGGMRAPHGARGISAARSIFRLRSVLKTVRPHALLSFIDVSNIFAILASRGLPVRVVVAERTHPAINPNVGRLWRALRRRLYPYADLVVAQTADAGDWLARTCHARVVVIPNSLRELPSPQAVREPLVLAVGRLSVEKGVDVLLRAFAKTRDAFPDWRLSIIGEGGYRAELTRLRDELQLAASVEFVGPERRIELWLSKASVFAHASRREGFPNAVLEAMGMGLAVVCTVCRAGPSELIQDGVNGRLVPVNDVDAFARAMMDLMSAPQVRADLGSAASSVRQRYRQERIMEQWQACLVPAIAPMRDAAGLLRS